MIPDEAVGGLVALLIGSNILTLVLLTLALRASWRWRNALSELGDLTRRDIRRFAHGEAAK